MKFSYDIAGGAALTRRLPIFGNGSDIVEGAVLIKGATAGTNQGFAIVGTGALADVIGVLGALHDFSVVGDSALTGVTYVRAPIIINPFGVYNAQYDADDDANVASVSGTGVTITSLEDNIDGGWLLGDDGFLTYITASASGSCTAKDNVETAPAATWDSDTDVIKILPLNHDLLKVNAAADQLGTDPAVGTARATVLENYIEANGVGHSPLDPTKHSGITYTNIRVFSDIVFLDHSYNKLA